MTKTVAQLMQTGILTVTPSMRVSELAAFLEDGGIHGAPVVDKHGKILGVVSRTDILRLLAERKGEDYYSLWPPKIEKKRIPQTVRDIMSHRIVSIAETASAKTAAALMDKEKIHRILVTREGAFVGILAASDLRESLAGSARPALTPTRNA